MTTMDYKQEAEIKRLKVKIVSTKLPTYWYAKLIGREFEVVDNYKLDYTLLDDYIKGYDAVHRHILKEDCKVLEHIKQL